MIGIKPNSILGYKYDDTEQSDTIFAVLNWTMLLMQVLKNIAGWCEK